VPFTLVHAGKYRTEDRLERQTDNTQNKHRILQKQQNDTSRVQSSLSTLGQETRWAYSTTLPRLRGAQICATE